MDTQKISLYRDLPKKIAHADNVFEVNFVALELIF